MSPRDRVETFHLLFLRSLVAQVSDRTLVVVKGGCNLRFFFGSPRYSEDLDLDVRTIATGTLRKKVDGILGGASLQKLLASRGLAIGDWSAPKQTETVQRWKAAILESGALPEPTKIEFSRRSSTGGKAEPVSAAVLDRLRLPGPIVAAHYLADEALRQKIDALVGRDEPQARDVFDMHWLLARGAVPPKLTARVREKATERVMDFSASDFGSQVVAYLEPDEQARWDAATLDAMQLRVVEALGA